MVTAALLRWSLNRDNPSGFELRHMSPSGRHRHLSTVSDPAQTGIATASVVVGLISEREQHQFRGRVASSDVIKRPQRCS
jgi:hypothetical protein